MIHFKQLEKTISQNILTLELSEISQKISFEDLNEIVWILDIFHIISSASEFENELKRCFK